MKACGKRSLVKVEYPEDPEKAAMQNTNLKLLQFDEKPEQEYQPGKRAQQNLKRKKTSSDMTQCQYCKELIPEVSSHLCYKIARKVK